MRLHTKLTVLLAVLAGACAGPTPPPMGDEGPGGGKADGFTRDNSTPIESVSLYNPLSLDPAIHYVDRMHSDLLAPELDEMDFDADRQAALENLDTAEQAYLMMAFAGMEYYPVGEYGEEDLDEALRNVVERGNPEGTGEPTGLTHVEAVKQPALGFRADIVRVEGRPHFIVAIRGTQITQPSFVQTFANGLADLSSVAAAIDQSDIYETRIDSLTDLVSLKRRVSRTFERNDFSDRRPRVHAGIYLASLTIFHEIDATLSGHLDLEFGRSRPQDGTDAQTPCVWITGHSLGGGMAPLIAYRLANSGEFTSSGGRICGVYTYGAPRVGNRGFADSYNETRIGSGESVDLGSVTFRYHMQDDVIPHLPPNIPHDDGGDVSELVAESVMAVARAHAPEMQRLEAWLADGGDAAALSEADAQVAQSVFGAGDLVRMVYRIMDEEGALDAIGTTAYRAAKERVAALIANFRGMQHVGHTRWIARHSEHSYQMAVGHPYQQHHLDWMLSYVEQLQRAVCVDTGTGMSTNVRQHVSNGLGFHRVPFYASVLLMHTDHAEGDGRFLYPYHDVDDRLPSGVGYRRIEGFQERLEQMYDAESDTYMTCPE